jgi:hypothetical protein
MISSFANLAGETGMSLRIAPFIFSRIAGISNAGQASASTREPPAPNVAPIRERRRYFRIEDEIVLFLRQVTPEQICLDDALDSHPLDAFSLSARLDLLTQEARMPLRRIARDQPELAEYLKILERKIELIARALLEKESDMADRSANRVSLSASGLAFDAEIGFERGALLELKMLLPPALVGVIAFGKVVYCSRNPDDAARPYRVAVDFIGIKEQDRELLIRHVIRKQSNQLRNHKQRKKD